VSAGELAGFALDFYFLGRSYPRQELAEAPPNDTRASQSLDDIIAFIGTEALRQAYPQYGREADFVWIRESLRGLQFCVDARSQIGAKPPIHITPGDRFITKQELLGLVAITEPTFLQMERAGRFPARIQISRGPVAWLHREVISWLNTRTRSMQEDAANAAWWASV